MPTSKPRVWVTLEPETYAVLKSMAELTGSTPGQVLCDLAEPALPSLTRLVDAAHQFAAWKASEEALLREVHEDVFQGVDAAVQALEARMGRSSRSDAPTGLLGALLPLFGSGAGDGPDRASTPRSAREAPSPEPPSGAPLTPPTNRGVILTRNKQNQRVSKGGRNRAI
jgi:hypothetical protein